VAGCNSSGTALHEFFRQSTNILDFKAALFFRAAFSFWEFSGDLDSKA